MNKIVLTLLFIFVSLLSFSQSTTFSGSVIEEESNVKMENAIVKIEGTVLASTTNAEGRFIFNTIIPSGQQFIIVTKNGYETYIKSFDFIEGRAPDMSGIILKLTKEEKKRRKKLNKSSDKEAKKERKAKEKKLKEIRKETEKREKELAKRKKKLEKQNEGVIVSYGVVNGATPDNNLEIPFETGVSNTDDYSALQQKYSKIIGVSPAEITNIPLYQFIDGWMGAPYKMGGSEIDGIDCSSFTQRLYQVVFEVYIARTAQAQADSKKIRQFTPPATPEVNDFVFFYQGSNEYDDSIGHVGIYLGNNKFVSATSTKTNGKSGVKIDDLSTSYWKKKFCCFGRTQGN
ncbi:MAG: cell wall-associated NlpC family hydrolase [Flavobacteriaceae bacterium]|jgi:lipoprotein Spr